MGTLYIDTGGSADNSGSSDNNTADLTGTAATRLSAGLIQLDIGTNLSGVVTAAGPTQSSINIAGATNSNQTIFWITAKDDALDQVTVTPDPTGMTTNAWKIGGRHVLTNARIEAALRAGDEAVFNNSPAAANAVRWTFRITGDSTSGMAKIRGKIGVRPVLNSTGTTSVISTSTGFSYSENLELDQDGASGNVVTLSGTNGIMNNVKISDGGGIGVSCANDFPAVLLSEITGVGGDGINIGGISRGFIFGNNIHDCTGDGLESAFTSSVPSELFFNIIDTNAGRGIFISAAVTANRPPTPVVSNTVYGNGNSGYEAADADAGAFLFNNIFQNNGDAAGEYNVEQAAGTFEFVGVHGYNCFNTAGGGGSGNVSGLTVNGTEITTDPLFVDPANGDFRLQRMSPCKGTGFPGQFLGGPLGYLDMGAVQRQEAPVPPLPIYQMGI